MERPATDLWVPNLVGDMKHVTTPKKSAASKKELKLKRCWFTQVEWIQCGNCLNQRFPVALRPGWTAMSILNWCEASGFGNGVGWTPKKMFWRKLVACWTNACAAEREKNCASFQHKNCCNLQAMMLKQLDFARQNSTIFAMKVSSFAMAKTTFFSKTLKTLARFSPRRDVYVYTVGSSRLSGNFFKYQREAPGCMDRIHFSQIFFSRFFRYYLKDSLASSWASLRS